MYVLVDVQMKARREGRESDRLLALVYVHPRDKKTKQLK